MLSSLPWLTGGCGARTGLDRGGFDAGPPEVLPDGAVACGGGPGAHTYLWAEDGTLYRFDPRSLTVSRWAQVSCPTSAGPWTLAVSQRGFALMLYDDWHIYRLHLSTLECERTAYDPNQIGLGRNTAIALSRDPGGERLYVVGETSAGPVLGVGDLTTFRLRRVARLTVDPASFLVDMRADPHGHLFILQDHGLFLELDAMTGELLREQHTTFDDMMTSAALLSWNDELLFFGGTQVSRYDLATNTRRPVDDVGFAVVGASAAPCIH